METSNVIWKSTLQLRVKTTIFWVLVRSWEVGSGGTKVSTALIYVRSQKTDCNASRQDLPVLLFSFFFLFSFMKVEANWFHVPGLCLNVLCMREILQAL